MKTTDKIGTCANCGSENINYGVQKLCDDMVFYPITCNDCNKESEEFYQLKYIETICHE